MISWEWRRNFYLGAVIPIAATAFFTLIPHFFTMCPTTGHALYWMAWTDESRLRALEGLIEDRSMSGVDVHADAFTSDSPLLNQAAERWFVRFCLGEQDGSVLRILHPRSFWGTRRTLWLAAWKEGHCIRLVVWIRGDDMDKLSPELHEDR